MDEQADKPPTSHRWLHGSAEFSTTIFVQMELFQQMEKKNKKKNKKKENNNSIRKRNCWPLVTKLGVNVALFSCIQFR